MTVLALQGEARSDTGPRPNNEDACFASPRLAAVADGVGGSAAGEIASQTLINALALLDKCRLEHALERALIESVAWGNQTVGFIAECRPHTAGMGTTLTVAAMTEGGTYLVANVGDSRAYLFRDGRLTRLTRDESLVQQLVDAGQLDAEEARNHPRRSVVLRALDGRTEIEPAMTTAEARRGDRLLLCSDGLSDVIEDEAIESALSTPQPADAADRLVALALQAGTRDNVSVVVADVEEQQMPRLWPI